CPNGLPWTTSFNVQRPATTRLWLQILPVVMADLLEPGRASVCQLYDAGSIMFRCALTKMLLLRARVPLQPLVDVLLELVDIHLSRLSSILQLLKRDVLRVAVVGLRLVATARNTHVKPPSSLLGLLAFRTGKSITKKQMVVRSPDRHQLTPDRRIGRELPPGDDARPLMSIAARD